MFAFKLNHIHTPQQFSHLGLWQILGANVRSIVSAFETRCPLSTKLFDRLLFETNHLTDPVAAIELDFHLALRMTKRADFAEGVRAIVIDKDQAPQWAPNSLEAVTETMLDAVFDRSGLPSLR